MNSALSQLSWEEIKVVVHDRTANSSLTATSSIGRRERYYLKLVTSEDSYCLLITDLINVWLRRSDADEIERERREYASAVKTSAVADIIRLLRQLLMDKKQQQHVLVKQRLVSAETADDTDSNSVSDASASSGASLIRLNCSMNMTPFTFRWTFECKPYGSPIDQSTLLAAQMIRPLIDIIKQLSFRLKRRHANGTETDTNTNHSAVVTPRERAEFESFSESYQFASLAPLYVDWAQRSADDRAIAADDDLSLSISHSPQPQAVEDDAEHDKGAESRANHSKSAEEEELERREALARRLESEQQQKKKKRRKFV